MSTWPKSIQATQDPSGDGQSSSGALHERRQACRELVENYKNLPNDFLRIPSSYYTSNHSQNDPALTMTLHRALGVADSVSGGGVGPLVDMIDISVVEAQLVKNYGLLRMDLYCKIRVGHMVCETQTCPNGAKNPKWDGVYQFSLTPGIDSFHLEIYDEKQFSLDEKIAWLHEPIPPEIFQGIAVERWFPLSGRSGPHKEGSVLLVVSHKRVPIRASKIRGPQHHHSLQIGSGPIYGPEQTQVIGGGPAMMPIDPSIHIPAYIQPHPAPIQTNSELHPPNTNVAVTQQREPIPEVRPASEEDINQLSEMFPSIHKGIIKDILENNHHDKDAAISELLALDRD